MPIVESSWEAHAWEVECDGCKLLSEASTTSSAMAERNASYAGFERIDGKWYCPTCAPKAKRAAKKAMAR